MTIELRATHPRRRIWFRATTVLAGAIALLFTALAAPAVAVVKTADPDAPFQLPQYDWRSSWSDLFSGPGDADFLRSGGVECTKPDPLPASNAGSGHGYRVPFTMAITDGRAIAGYSPVALEAGQFPFGTSAYGITGWVRGWVELPSLRISIPDDGTTLCSGSGALWGNLTNPAGFGTTPGIFSRLAAGSEFPAGTTNHASSELIPAGTPQASITGLTPSGALEFQASMPVDVHVKQGSTNDCILAVNVNLDTATAALPTSFPKIDGALPSDPSQWLSRSYYDKYYQDPFDMDSTPPTRYYMPPRALDGAIAGQSATAANATMTMPTPQLTGQCEQSPYGGGFADKIKQMLAPVSRVGTVQPSWPLLPGPFCFPGFPCDPAPGPWYNVLATGVTMPLFEIPSGSVQTSLDITLADIGLPKGLPSGYGFS